MHIAICPGFQCEAFTITDRNASAASPVQLQILVLRKIIFPWIKRQILCDSNIVACSQAEMADQRGGLSDVKDKTEAVEMFLFIKILIP